MSSDKRARACVSLCVTVCYLAPTTTTHCHAATPPRSTPPRHRKPARRPTARPLLFTGVSQQRRRHPDEHLQGCSECRPGYQRSFLTSYPSLTLTQFCVFMKTVLFCTELIRHYHSASINDSCGCKHCCANAKCTNQLTYLLTSNLQRLLL